MHLSAVEMFTSALCMTVALTVFVFWEVFGMVVRSKNLKGLLRVIEVPPSEFQAAMANQHKDEQRQNIRTIKIWVVALIFTVGPGLVAAGILIYSFGRLLWEAI